MPQANYDYVGQIIAFESGELDHDAIVTLFQHLLDTKILYSLQGFYQRTAQDLINAGLIS